MTYEQFLNRKLEKPRAQGLKSVGEIHPALFDFQQNCVRAALEHGRFALFLDTGLGKTICQLEWCRQLSGKSLILAPLAVAEQTRREAETKLGMEVKHSRDGSADAKVTVTNYERMHLFDLSQFEAVVLDESSILKSFMGKTKQQLCDSFSRTPFRLCCTATPAPNDYMELGNHSAFLGIMEGSEMLTRWFINDTMHFGQYRLKGHAVKPFWEWVASWAACAEKPSDAGGDDSRFELPPLDVKLNQVESDYSDGAQDGNLFRVAEMSATSMHKEKRHSLFKRVQKAVELSQGPDPVIIWCETNDESRLISEALGDSCVEITGALSMDEKEYRLESFMGLCGNQNTTPPPRVLVTKPSIAGYGLNLQFCHHQIFVSLSYSYESFYQAVRRSWRFGQKNPVRIDVILAEAEMPLWQTISRKMTAHRQMKDAMKFARLDLGRSSKTKHDYHPNHNGHLPSWLQTMAA